MSRTLHLKDQIEALCAAAGIRASGVRSIHIANELVTFELIDHPGFNHPVESVIVSFPFVWSEPVWP